MSCVLGLSFDLLPPVQSCFTQYAIRTMQYETNRLSRTKITFFGARAATYGTSFGSQTNSGKGRREKMGKLNPSDNFNL